MLRRTSGSCRAISYSPGKSLRQKPDCLRAGTGEDHFMISRSSFLLLAPALLLAAGIAISDDVERSLYPFPNENGVGQTFVSTGRLDTTGPFFQSLGTNGRSCATCHQPGESWSVTPQQIRRRFDSSQGTDPIFRTNDGSNCSDSDVSTVSARRSA